MTEHRQIPMQLDLNFDPVSSDVVPYELTKLAAAGRVLAEAEVVVEASVLSSRTSGVSAAVVNLSKFRAAAIRDSSVQLYENIFESIKHIG